MPGLNAYTGSSEDATALISGTGKDGKPIAFDLSQVVTAEDLTGVTAKLEGQSGVLGKMRGEMDKLSGTIAELTAKLGAGGTPPAPPSPGSGTPPAGAMDPVLAEKLKAFEENQKRVTDREEKQKQYAMRSSVREALLKNGADAGLVDMAVDSILTRNRNAVVAQEDDLGGYVVGIVQAEGMPPVAVENWAADFLKTESGKRLLPATPVPSHGMRPTGTGAAGGKIGITREQMSSLDPKELASGKYFLTDLSM